MKWLGKEGIEYILMMITKCGNSFKSLIRHAINSGWSCIKLDPIEILLIMSEIFTILWEMEEFYLRLPYFLESAPP